MPSAPTWRYDSVTTGEEKKEPFDEIATHPRYYRITLWGYGGESSYMELTKEQYEFWNNVIQEHGDSDAVNYCVNADDGIFDFDYIGEVLPDAVQFLTVKGCNYGSSWYEAPTEFAHQWGIDYGNARIAIEEVDGDDYNASFISEVVGGDELSEWVDVIQEEDDNATEIVEMGVYNGADDNPDYVLQFWSSEKGTFFDGIIETVGEFDPLRLKFKTIEYLNGDDTVDSIEYDGEEVVNAGGDTVGKGYSVHVWSNICE